MKYLLALLALLIFAGLLHYHHTTTHPIYSRETYLFRDRLAQIAEDINNSDATWTAGHNIMFDHMGIDAVKGLMGVLDTPSPKKLPIKDITPLPNIPETFDPRNEWPKCESLKEIRD